MHAFVSAQPVVLECLKFVIGNVLWFIWVAMCYSVCCLFTLTKKACTLLFGFGTSINDYLVSLFLKNNDEKYTEEETYIAENHGSIQKLIKKSIYKFSIYVSTKTIELKIFLSQGDPIKRIPKECKKILEDWFLANTTNPYATLKDLLELHRKTGLEIKQIKRWFYNKRMKATLEERQNLKWSHFLKDEKSILDDFFENRSQYPNKKDIDYLVDVLQKSPKKIKQWFSKKRRNL